MTLTGFTITPNGGSTGIWVNSLSGTQSVTISNNTTNGFSGDGI